MIKALILDFGGVIVTMNADAASAQTVAAELGVSPNQVMAEVMGHSDWTDALLGKLTIEQFDQRLHQRLGRSYDPARTPAIYRMFADERLSDRLLALSDELRAARGKSAILSNATYDLEQGILADKLGILDRFDLVVNSARLGMIKPDPAIYRHTLDRLGVAPHEAIFVDDIPVNVTGAAALGIQAVHFRNEEQAVANIRTILARTNGA